MKKIILSLVLSLSLQATLISIDVGKFPSNFNLNFKTAKVLIYQNDLKQSQSFNLNNNFKDIMLVHSLFLKSDSINAPKAFELIFENRTIKCLKFRIEETIEKKETCAIKAQESGSIIEQTREKFKLKCQF